MILTKEGFNRARDFVLTNARMIERRLFHFYFEGADQVGVYHAVYAYRNADGGFGHGMEPDTASPESQPLFSVMALEILDEIGYLSADLISSDFMPYFESVTTDKGGIPWMFKPSSSYPCEAHFKTVKEWAALSTTAPLLGMLEKYGMDSPWMIKAEQFIWGEFERIGDKHVFCYLCVPRWLQFLQFCKNQDKAKRTINSLKQWILADGILCGDRSDPGWGLYGKPHSLNYASSPQHVLSSIFPQSMIESDLNELIGRQREDGSWGTWYGISAGTKLEWAGIQTLWVLKTLRNYGRIDY